FAVAPDAQQLGAVLAGDAQRAKFPAGTLALVKNAERAVLWGFLEIDAGVKADVVKNLKGEKEFKDIVDQIGRASSAGIWFDMQNKQLNIHAGLACANGEDAGVVRTKLSTLWEQNKEGLKVVMGLLDRDPKAAVAKPLLQELLDSLNFLARGNVVQASVSFK